VPADAFYEWQKLDAKTKQPFAIAMKDGQPYALAGLWDKWKDRKVGSDLLTFTVITTNPNEVVLPMHDRMPVIVPEREYDRWLNVSDTQRLPLDLLRPFDADRMTAWKVGKDVGNVKNDRPELIEPEGHADAKLAHTLADAIGHAKGSGHLGRKSVTVRSGWEGEFTGRVKGHSERGHMGLHQNVGDNDLGLEFRMGAHKPRIPDASHIEPGPTIEAAFLD
jgi:SOS response associated peptidase (SRAP)